MKESGNIKLDGLNKKLPFAVPDGYFEKFSATIPAPTSAGVRKVSLYHTLRPYLFAVAIFVGILLISIPVYRKIHSPKEIPVSDLKSYVVNEMDEETVVDYVADAESK